MDENKTPPILTEVDFYPPQDKRILHSGLDNIHGNTFSSYLNEYFELCDEEEVYDEKILDK